MKLWKMSDDGETIWVCADSKEDALACVQAEFGDTFFDRAPTVTEETDHALSTLTLVGDKDRKVTMLELARTARKAEVIAGTCF